MSEFEDLEGPRRNKRTVFILMNSNQRTVALTSRVEMRSMQGAGYRKRGSVEVEDGEAHIGDKIWVVLSSKTPKAAYHDKASAQSHAEESDSLVGITVKSWDVRKEKLYSVRRLRKRRDDGLV